MNGFFRIATSAMGAIAATTLLASAACASVLTSRTSADNGYVLYISTNDAATGTRFGGANDWLTTYVDSTTLQAGTDYYLHVYVYDQGGIAGYLSELSLTGTGHTFANGLASLTSGTTYWSGNNTGFGQPYFAMTDLGAHGVGPWGARPGITQSARWIWAGNAVSNDSAYISTKISATVATHVPEPTSAALLGFGLLGLAAVRRKSAKHQ